MSISQFDSASRRSKKQPLSHRASTNSNSGSSSSILLSSPSVGLPNESSSPHPPSSNPSGIHLILRFDDLLIPPGKQDEEIEIFFSLYHKSSVNQSAFISERAFLSPVAQTGDFVQSSVLFWDILDSMELCKSVYVVVQMYKNGNRLIIHNENARRTSSGAGLGGALRRPFGVAVLGPFANIAWVIDRLFGQTWTGWVEKRGRSGCPIFFFDELFAVSIMKGKK